MAGRGTRGTRSNGDGSLWTRSDTGQYRIAVTVGGHRVTRTLPLGTSPEEAEAELRALLVRRDRRELSTDDRQSVTHYLDTWLDDVVQHTVRHHTYLEYQSRVRLVQRRLGGTRLGDLRAAHCNRLYADLMREGKSANTVRALHATLHRALEDAVRSEILTRNPADHASRPRLPDEEAASLTLDQARTLLRETEGTEWHALWVLLLMTGLRLGEALALRWSDVAGEVLAVKSTITPSPEGLTTGPPKSRRGRRSVPLVPSVQRALAAHRRRQAERRLATRNWVDADLVFPNRHGGLSRLLTPEQGLRRDLALLDLPAVTPHALRHTFASINLNDGRQMRLVQELMGHASVSITQGIYGHLERGTVDRAMARLEELFEQEERG